MEGRLRLSPTLSSRHDPRGYFGMLLLSYLWTLQTYSLSCISWASLACSYRISSCSFLTTQTATLLSQDFLGCSLCVFGKPCSRPCPFSLCPEPPRCHDPKPSAGPALLAAPVSGERHSGPVPQTLSLIPRYSRMDATARRLS